MRWLGMIAGVVTLAAAVFNIVVFSRLKVDFGGFATVGLSTAAFMAFTIALGFVTVRLMLRRDEDDEGQPDPSEDEGMTRAKPKG